MKNNIKFFHNGVRINGKFASRALLLKVHDAASRIPGDLHDHIAKGFEVTRDEATLICGYVSEFPVHYGNAVGSSGPRIQVLAGIAVIDGVAVPECTLRECFEDAYVNLKLKDGHAGFARELAKRDFHVSRDEARVLCFNIRLHQELLKLEEVAEKPAKLPQEEPLTVEQEASRDLAAKVKILKSSFDGETIELLHNKEWLEVRPCDVLRAITEFGIGTGRIRVKPSKPTIVVNHITVPAPAVRMMSYGESFWLADVAYRNPLTPELRKWAGSARQIEWLNKGLVHDSKEGAVAHIKAMTTPGEEWVESHDEVRTVVSRKWDDVIF